MDVPPEYSYQLISKHRSSLQRQLEEALQIQREKCDLLLNSKGEWGINLIPQLTNDPEYMTEYHKVRELATKRQRTENDVEGQNQGQNKRQRHIEESTEERSAETNVAHGTESARTELPLPGQGTAKTGVLECDTAAGHERGPS